MLKTTESREASRPTTVPTEALLTANDLANRWQCHPGTLANDRSAGRGVPWVKIGSSVRYLLSDVEAYEQAARVSTLDAA